MRGYPTRWKDQGAVHSARQAVPRARLRLARRNGTRSQSVLFPPRRNGPIALQEALRRSPPRTDSRDSLTMWLCEMHNGVNKRLGKPVFECSLASLDERWKSGHPDCDDDAPGDHFEH